MSGAPSVSVIVPARDAVRTLPRLLSAMATQRAAGGHELIVVDNGSRDGTAELAEGSGAATVLRRRRGEGPGAARNAGAAVARGSVLAFVDADCWPAPGWLAAGAAAAADTELVQGRVETDPAAPRAPFDRTLTVGRGGPLFESANLFVGRTLFERLGGFPAGLEVLLGPRLQGPFGEDVIFGWRARRAGARTGFCAEAVVYHEVVARRGAEFAAERRRLELFPLLVREVPELRHELLLGRLFLSRRTAAFDLALAAVALGVRGHQRLGALGLLPYLRELSAEAGRWGRGEAVEAVLGGLAADAVGAAALLRGSLRFRSAVL